MIPDFSVHFVQQIECAMWRDFWRENFNSATKNYQRIIHHPHLCMVCINKLLFSFASTNVVVMCFVVKVLKKALCNGEEMSGTQRTWEKEMQVSCWLSVYCWILKTVRLLLQMHKKTRCVFSYLFLKILQNQWNYQTLLYKKINWCLTKKWWRSVGGTILDKMVNSEVGIT